MWQRVRPILSAFGELGEVATAYAVATVVVVNLVKTVRLGSDSFSPRDLFEFEHAGTYAVVGGLTAVCAYVHGRIRAAGRGTEGVEEDVRTWLFRLIWAATVLWFFQEAYAGHSSVWLGVGLGCVVIGAEIMKTKIRRRHARPNASASPGVRG